MPVSDDAVLELIFNPEAQGLSLDSIEATVDTTAEKAFDPELLEKLQKLEKEAIDFAENGDTDSALATLNKCIETEKEYPSAYNNRAQIYRMRKEDDLALKDLDTVIKLAEGQPKVLRQAHTQRAILRRQQGDLVGAREDFATGAKYGNPFARNVTINENPYAKMCNQVMMEVMSRETMRACPPSTSGNKQ
ncbi:Tetratricopeptide repeat protein 36 [Apophysomyces sp. BC1034]|nr:Tetratricopeptide repeat protein 36 [Apophysomyces sp. BC1015]KAG0180981.1 Tetratricopeptide repeat protein 36 [Apophysomyces sp. BC1021]KAG0191410.1 Tetratricopeptide repeat protein 36 [Apophysomyces sp. BC1034]